MRDQYPLGSVLKARVLFHNAGKTPVVFKTDTWHQYDHHTARDAKGNDIKVTGPRYSGITLSATYRLAPGEYCEVMGARHRDRRGKVRRGIQHRKRRRRYRSEGRGRRSSFAHSRRNSW